MRLPFTVISADSSASGCPASNLHDPTPHSPGCSPSNPKFQTPNSKPQTQTLTLTLALTLNLKP